MNDLAALVRERADVLYLEPADARHGEAALAARGGEFCGVVPLAR